MIGAMLATHNWYEAFAPSTWSNWALVVIGTLGICAAIRSLDVLRVQTEATKASADAAVSSERAWVMIDLERIPGLGTILHGATQERVGPRRYSTDARIRCVCCNQGKTPAKILEKRAALLFVNPDNPLPLEPNLVIEIQDPVPHYLQNKDESKRDWTLSVDGRGEEGTMTVVYGVVKYRHIFSNEEVYSTFGYRITVNGEFQRLIGYPKYNENT